MATPNKTFTQDCVEADNGFKCGGCKSLNGTTNKTDSGNIPWVISCKECLSGYDLTSMNLTVTLTNDTTNKKAAARSDLSIYCYKVPEALPPSDGTTALIVVVIMAIISFSCIVGLVIFFFKRKPPVLPTEPKWPTEAPSGTQ